MRVDVHTHILPRTWPDFAKRSGYPGWVRLEHDGGGCARMMIDDKHFRDVKEPCWDPGARLRDCERTGIDAQVLSTVPVLFSYWAKPEHAHDLARLLNDHIAEVCRAHPRRFAGLGTVPLQDADRACAELERCVRELGLAGIEIGTHVGGKNLDDATIFPVLERAEALGAAVFVHPWDMLGKDRMQRYFLPWLVGMPAETSIAICSLIFGGVLERLPRLRLLFAHGGGAFPGTLGRIDHGYKARPDLCATCSGPPSSYVRRLYLDSLVHDVDALRLIVRRFGMDRVLLGSDYPFPLGEDEPGCLLDDMPELSEQDRGWILGLNALAFLGLDRDLRRVATA